MVIVPSLVEILILLAESRNYPLAILGLFSTYYKAILSNLHLDHPGFLDTAVTEQGSELVHQPLERYGWERK